MREFIEKRIEDLKNLNGVLEICSGFTPLVQNEAVIHEIYVLKKVLKLYKNEVEFSKLEKGQNPD